MCLLVAYSDSRKEMQTVYFDGSEDKTTFLLCSVFLSFIYSFCDKKRQYFNFQSQLQFSLLLMLNLSSEIYSAVKMSSAMTGWVGHFK